MQTSQFAHKHKCGTSSGLVTSTHSTEMLHYTVRICVVNGGHSTELHLWLTHVADSHWFTGSSQQKNLSQWKSSPFTGIRQCCVCLRKQFRFFIIYHSERQECEIQCQLNSHTLIKGELNVVSFERSCLRALSASLKTLTKIIIIKVE